MISLTELESEVQGLGKLECVKAGKVTLDTNTSSVTVSLSGLEISSPNQYMIILDSGLWSGQNASSRWNIFWDNKTASSFDIKQSGASSEIAVSYQVIKLY